MPVETLSILEATGVVAATVFGAVAALSWGLNRSVSRSEGLKVVFEGSKPEVDIVFVHGLGGDPVETWTSRSNGKAVDWTTRFLPYCIETRNGRRRQIRVLTYGYSSELFAASHSSLPAKFTDKMVFNYLPQALYLHSTRLIEQLADLRVGDAEKRPVIFIGHSLGGLIVKSALVHTSVAVDEREARLKSIQLLTLGVLFFGTPQREMPGKRWSELLLKLFRVAKLTSLKGAIQPLADQAELLNLQIERYKSIESNFFNFSFYETPKSQGGLPGSKIVEADMAKPFEVKNHTWEKVALKRAYKDLARFDSEQDLGFIEVISRINQCLETENYERALDRCATFFMYRDSPSASTSDLSGSQQDAKAEFVKVKQDAAIGKPPNWKKAIETKQEALRKVEEVKGLSDSETLTIVQTMADYAFEAREYERAEALYKRVFVAMQAQAPCSKEAVNVLKDMAAVAVRQGRIVEATKILRRARDMQGILGLKQNDLEVLMVTRQIAGLYESRHLHDEALQEYDKIITNFPSTPRAKSDETPGRKDSKAGMWRKKSMGSKHALVVSRSKRVNRLFDTLTIID